jgi:acyl carrier protein
MSDVKDDIKAYLIKQIEKKSRLPADFDHTNYDYIDAGHVDSIGIIKFVVDIEAHFDIELNEGDIESAEFRTLDGLTGIIARKLDRRK